MSTIGSWPMDKWGEVDGAAGTGAWAGAALPHDMPSPPAPPEHAMVPSARASQLKREIFMFFSLSPVLHQVERRQRQHLGRVDDVVDAAVLVGLMRQLESARAVRDAMGHIGDARHVLVIVGP